ncbi:MAG TPA: pathogenicity locus [Nitrospirae bacterium]|nr:pathogenicity locus [bacterium BMS3Abin06]HDH11840.1 pathogenicity locus [Nitrospirota bacterium]HDZ02818.1 pathogenicity locus [Nitrospirota bacterium]
MKMSEQSKKAILKNLQSLTNVGPAIAKKLYLIGIRTPEEAINADPEDLYRRLQEKLGCHVDRCVLYVFRGAKTGRPWPECSDKPKL